MEPLIDPPRPNQWLILMHAYLYFPPPPCQDILVKRNWYTSSMTMVIKLPWGTISEARLHSMI